MHDPSSGSESGGASSSDAGAFPAGASSGGHANDLPNGDSAGSSGDATNAGAAGTDTTGSEPDAGTGGAQAALCQHFANIWQQRQAEREPGEPIPADDSPAPCFDCLRAQDASCNRPQAECAANSACIDRHCLCTKEQPVAAMCNVPTYPPDLCSCIHSCTPAANSNCEDQWHSYMRCAVAACAAVCE